MEYHRRTHLKEKLEKCSFCKKSFVNPSTLRNHIKTVHNEMVKPYSCRKCEKRFAKESLLKIHWKIHFNAVGDQTEMESSFKCPYCPIDNSYKFSRWGAVLRHCMKQHP